MESTSHDASHKQVPEVPNPVLTFCIPLHPPSSNMDHVKAQLRSLVGRPEIKHSRFSLNNELLQDPKVLAAVAGFLIILLIVYREFSYLVTLGEVDWDVVTTSSKKTSRRGGPANVLLVGPVDAGKTSLFAKVRSTSYSTASGANPG